MGWPSVRGFVDGDNVNAEILNTPINQLVERTEYLLRELNNNDGTRVCLTGVELADPFEEGSPSVGQVVYRVPGSFTFAIASATVGEGQWFYADQRAMAVGVVSRVEGKTATVVLYGLVDFGDDGIDADGLIADPVGVRESGRYYLSAKKGKLTSSPNGPVIYVGDCALSEDGRRVMSILVNPQYRDTGESHVHRSFAIGSAPLGGYVVKSSGTDPRYLATGIMADGVVPGAEVPKGIVIVPEGHWTSNERHLAYTLSLQKTSWSDCKLIWSSDGDGSGSADVAFDDSGVTGAVQVGTLGLSVRLVRIADTAPEDVGDDTTWTLDMPNAARAWMNYDNGEEHGYRFNLGMHPEMARYVPPVPANGASLSVDGVELRGSAFGNRRRWEVMPAEDGSGPWLVWYGGEVKADSASAPFLWRGAGVKPGERDILLCVNRMRVGPDGFVTSLQPAPGSAVKVTSAQTGAAAVQGALMIDLDISFATEAASVAGSQVVKQIRGNRFLTGPVVEKVIAGPGLQVNRQQGVVTISSANAVYAGDFETIALKNAKQDVAGGVFPYTKLLGWTRGAQNVQTGFAAKFRVPDYLPYRDYNVIVSASVFGEKAVGAGGDSVAAFSLAAYALKDFSLSPDAVDAGDLAGSITHPVTGKGGVVVPVSFAGGYQAFDPVLIHGFEALSRSGQRQYVGDLMLKAADGTPLLVRPGHFVGLDVSRCAPSGNLVTWYTAQLGFVSLRWNLVEAEVRT